MALNAQYASTPFISGVILAATADTSLTAPTTVGTVATGTSLGTRISRITIKALATTSTGLVRLFIYNGTTYYLVKEIFVPVTTSNDTSTAFESINSELTDIAFLPIILPNATYSLRATTTQAVSFAVTAHGGSL